MLAEHFGSLEQQKKAAVLGMWLFLGTEILLFAGLFTGYAVYRSLYPETFRRASEHLDIALGTVNTLVLITSSLTVALAVHAARAGRPRWIAPALFVSILLGCAFLAIKAVEYRHKFQEGALPGKYYTFAALQAPGAALFFTLYFLTTGLHGLHVTAGVGVLSWLMGRARRGAFTAEEHAPLELGGMYWHLVDLIWIFLYPLLYLV